ncbi:HlyD family secretion protein [Lonsdalea quercina]|uniref:HlyD family secretion protein n=1 Tax=Lonsdalea quercina TaxID=71657 RepID=UPI003974FC4F
MTKYRLPILPSLLLRHRRIGGGLLILFLVLTVSIWTPWKSNDKDPSPDAQAQWLPVQPQPLEQQLGLVGRIQAARQETLSAPFEGVIREVLVQEGQSVSADQTLLRLDTGQIAIQMRQAQTELLKAQQAVYQLRNWSSSPEVTRARRTVQTARSTLGVTQANLRDTRVLFERGIVARMEVDTLTQQAHTQQQDLLNAEEELHTLEARGSGEEREIAEMELVNAQVRYQSVKAQSERQIIKAPFAGVIIRPSAPDGGKAVIAQPGLQVTQGTPLLTLIGLERLQVLTRVEEIDLHQLSEGMPVHITGEGFANRALTGHIATIAVQGDAAEAPGSSAHYDVVVAVDTPQNGTGERIRLGMSAKLAVVLYRNEHGIAVPLQALRIDDSGETYVLYRAAPNAETEKVIVTPGRAIAQGIEVQGLSAGYVLTPTL